MDRVWYVRLASVVAAVIGAWFVLWPTLDQNGWVSAPAFVTDNIDRHITAGLDIQGGLRMMYTVDMNAAIRSRRQARGQQVLRRLAEKLDIVPEGELPNETQRAELAARVSLSEGSSPGSRVIAFTFTNPPEHPNDIDQFDRDLISHFADLHELERTETTVRLELTEESIEQLQEVAVEQAEETIKNRISELGISEANVRSRDIDISVEVPGAGEEDFNRIRDVISQTARLDFKIVDDGNAFVSNLEGLPDGIRVERGGVRQNEHRPATTDYYLIAEHAGPCPTGVSPDVNAEGEALTRQQLRGEVPAEDDWKCSARAILSAYLDQVTRSGDVPAGRSLALSRVDADPTPEELLHPDPVGEVDWRSYLLYDLPPNGSEAVTGEHLEDAAVGTDQTTEYPVVSFQMTTNGASRMQDLTQGNLGRRMAVVLDGEVKSAPVIQSRIGAHGQITLGGARDYNVVLDEARELVIVLRAGALPAPIIPQNEQLIGPTLGRDSVKQGALGAVIGIALVLIFMAVYYQVAGLVADLMVVLNLLFMVAIMAFLNNDLTLPGIAGVALTVGMAVDANVLITERMREELRAGKSARAAVDQGFRRAFWSIFDSQLTTFIAGVVLFQYGSPEIRGFARTLMIGIGTSLFTGYFCSKVMFDWLVRGLRVQQLKVG